MTLCWKGNKKYGDQTGVSLVFVWRSYKIDWQWALATYTWTVPLWLRYVDDTFIAVHKDGIDNFHEHLNRQNADIQFTTKIEENGKIPFLDCLVTRDNNKRLFTENRNIPTNYWTSLRTTWLLTRLLLLLKNCTILISKARLYIVLKTLGGFWSFLKLYMYSQIETLMYAVMSQKMWRLSKMLSCIRKIAIQVKRLNYNKIFQWKKHRDWWGDIQLW